MQSFSRYGLSIPHVLLPGPEVDLEKWAVIACDQFTSQPDYWQKVESFVSDAPSTLQIIYPEAWLSQGDGRIARINEKMAEYKNTVLTRCVEGFEIVWRQIGSGIRTGLMAEIDLEQYDPMKGSASLIRATEETVAERIPPRVHIRENATLESPHVLMLVDDPGRTLIEPLSDAVKAASPLYDTPLMLGGGRVRAAQVPASLHPAMLDALEGLLQGGKGLLFAVGDGNHSLATARACWLSLRERLTPAQRAIHPARWALVEIENIYDASLRFEPIHRALYGADETDLRRAFEAWLRERNMSLAVGGACACLVKEQKIFFHAADDPNPLPLFHIQKFLDDYLAARPHVRIDYVHGADALSQLAAKGAIGILLPAMDKSALFQAVRLGGSLPRKTFSMGSAVEKRYYLECRQITAKE